MPIKSFKTRPARIDASLPELARLYKGAARESAAQKNVPPDLDYFRFEPANLPTATAEDIRAAFGYLYGDKPKIIRNVQFISDSQPHAFDAWFESWGRSRSGAALLNRRCDGETVVFERDGDTIVRDPRPCDRKCDCKASGRLRLFLPDLCAELGVLGTVTLVTHASTDIDNINGTLAFALNNAGRLRGLAFVLYREPMQLMTPAGMPITKSIVRLELDTRSAQALALEAGDPLALPNGMHALPAGLPPHDADGVIYDGPQTGGNWANAASVTKLMTALVAAWDGVTWPEMCALVGIDAVGAPERWNVYESMRAAGEAIEAALNEAEAVTE